MSPSTTRPATPAQPAHAVLRSGQPVLTRRRWWQLRAPAWLQLILILLLLASAVYAYLDDHLLLCFFMALGGLCFGASFLLRRMVGDDYDRA